MGLAELASVETMSIPEMNKSNVLPVDRMKVGELRAAYGLQGWLWLYSDTDPISNIFGYQPWWVETRTGWKQMEVKRWRTQGKGLVVSLAGVLDRNDADLMMGATVWVDRRVLPAAPVNEYYCLIWWVCGCMPMSQTILTMRPLMIARWLHLCF
jgi:ribosomal 30S subunit maturation factor RimM